MDVDQKEQLARKNDDGLEAAAIRIRAARKLAGLDQKQVAKACGLKNTVISNAENGATFPSRALMGYYFRAHRIDYNFLFMGHFAQLPGDVQDRLWPALEFATIEWDRKEGSGRGRERTTADQASE